MKLDFAREIFKEAQISKFYQNRSSRSQVVPCGRTDRRMDIKLIAAVRSFAKTPKKGQET